MTKDELREYHRRWEAAHKEARRAAAKKYREAHRDKCRAASRNYQTRNRARGGHYLTRYGMTALDYERMFAEQGGKCAICGAEISLIRGTSNFRRTDHDHSKQRGDPGHIRGLLCDGCNILLGKAKDSPAILRAAVAYLEKPRTQEFK